MEDQITGEGAIEIAISLGMSRRGGDDNSLVTFHVVVLWRAGVCWVEVCALSRQELAKPRAKVCGWGYANGLGIFARPRVGRSCMVCICVVYFTALLSILHFFSLLNACRRALFLKRQDVGGSTASMLAIWYFWAPLESF